MRRLLVEVGKAIGGLAVVCGGGGTVLVACIAFGAWMGGPTAPGTAFAWAAGAWVVAMGTVLGVMNWKDS